MKRLVLALLLLVAGCVDSLVGADPSTSPTAMFDTIWRDFDQNYVGFDVHHVDWSDVYRRYKPRADAAPNLAALAPIIGQMFAELHDAHVELLTPGAAYESVDVASIPGNFDLGLVFAQYVSTKGTTPSGTMRYGMIGSDVGYVYVSTFTGSGWGTQIDGALAALSGTRGLIIDVRDNLGGNSSNADPIAARFFDSTRTAVWQRYRSGPGHDDMTDYLPATIAPRAPRYMNPVVVLTNRRTASSAETFVLEMRAQPGITILGDTTLGIQTNPFAREAGQGWYYRIPRALTYGHDKALFEGSGIPPSVFVRETQRDLDAGHDVQLEAALAIVRRS